ncbi:hypothetical protein ACIPF8_22650 [Collimonas sp. NPDC087041]|uniref:hypothetical protein n=1 Tax=Collimonas sp. NPDC087041 TaxID=3363960 RepID=UPI0037F15087
MNNNYFPLSYRWFLAKGLTKWQPWYFIDTDFSVKEAPNCVENQFATRAFKVETGADFDVYLFARRQDMDDYAFFVVRDGKIEDKVVSMHLSFAKKLELNEPLRYSEIKQSFVQWLREIVIADVEYWISEEDMYDE